MIAAWFAWNTLAPASLRFDPYTFTFLTLILSLQASYAAPLILLAQNRQADRDRLTMEEDRRRAAMQKADTEYLAREIASLRIAVGEVATRDFLRSELARLAEELDEAAHRRQKLEPQGRWEDDRKERERTPDPDVAWSACQHPPPPSRTRSRPPSPPSTTPRSAARSPSSAWSRASPSAATAWSGSSCCSPSPAARCGTS